MVNDEFFNLVFEDIKDWTFVELAAYIQFAFKYYPFFLGMEYISSYILVEIGYNLTWSIEKIYISCPYAIDLQQALILIWGATFFHINFLSMFKVTKVKVRLIYLTKEKFGNYKEVHWWIVVRAWQSWTTVTSLQKLYLWDCSHRKLLWETWEFFIWPIKRKRRLVSSKYISHTPSYASS